MKIALLNAFPNLPHSAEREFIERCLAVLAAAGHEARAVVTSDEILAFDPDAVIVTHEFVAKTTDHFTVGLLWSPTQFYRDQEDRLKAIRSWDLAVPINAATRSLARNLHFPLRHDSAVSDLDFYPSAPVVDLPQPDPDRLGLVYVGAHWDGQRHRRLLETLARLTPLNAYGPAKAWEFLPTSYRGSIPFDGRSLVPTLNRHGIVLALHKREHVDEDTPSMRVFEACAARCAVITEPLPALEKLFGDRLQYVDTQRAPQRVARDIADIVERHRADPAAFARGVTQTHEVFRKRASLDHLLHGLVEEIAARKALVRQRLVAVPAQAAPEVSIIIRCGSRPLAVLQRAVASVAAQTHPRVALILVRFAEIEGWQPWIEGLRAGGRFTEVREVGAPGGGLRSAAMWAGLRAVRSEFFALLDDDDEWFADHLAHLVGLLQRDRGCAFAYAGAVRQEEDGALLNTHDRFKGELNAEIRERRELKFMDNFNLDRLLRFDNFILSHAWVARSHVLTPDVLDDPELEVGEDVYLYLLLATRHRFRFNGRVSVVWNWRSNAQDNSMLAVSQQRWARCAALLSERLAHLEFPGCFEGRDVIGRGRVPRLPLVEARLPAVAPQPVAAVRRSLPRTLVHRMLRVASGGRAFLSSADPLPFDENEIVASIDFTQAELTPLVTNVRGLSDLEGWGCWTDGPTLTLEFRRPLPPRFTLHLIGHAHRLQHEQPLRVAVGRHEAPLQMSARLRACRYLVALENPEGARSLVLRIPNARSPASVEAGAKETRRLGVGLVRLDIVAR